MREGTHGEGRVDSGKVRYMRGIEAADVGGNGRKAGI